jgi:hypothetical protein
MDWGALLFWPIGGLIALSAIWASYLGRRESERTIRLAIDKGQVLDAETVRGLKGQSNRAPKQLVVAGIVLVALAAGTAIFGWTAGQEDSDALLPMLGVAAMTGLPGVALIVCGQWLRRDSDGQS